MTAASRWKARSAKVPRSRCTCRRAAQCRRSRCKPRPELLPLVVARTLVEERVDGFLMVLGQVRQRLIGRRHLHDDVEADILALAHHALRHAQHVRRLARNLACEDIRLLHEVSGRNDAADKAPVQCRLRIDRIAGEEQLRGAVMADGARQDPRTAVARHEADLQERGAEYRIVGGEPHVGQTGHVVAKADRRSIHRGDQRHLQVPQALHDAMDARPIALADVHAGTGKGARPLAHRLDVAAGRERRACANQDRTADRAVGVDRGTSIGEQRPIAVLAQRVAAFRPGERQRDDGTVLFDQQGGHGVLRQNSVKAVFTTLLRSPLTGARHSNRMSGNMPAVPNRLKGVRASLSAFAEAFRASYSPRTQAEADFVEKQLNIGLQGASKTWYLLPAVAILIAITNIAWLPPWRVAPWPLLMIAACVGRGQNFRYVAARKDAATVAGTRRKAHAFVLGTLAQAIALCSIGILYWAPV